MVATERSNKEDLTARKNMLTGAAEAGRDSVVRITEKRTLDTRKFYGSTGAENKRRITEICSSL